MKPLSNLLFAAIVLTTASIAGAHEVDAGGRQNMLNVETTDLPQGKVRISAGERTHPPGARTPWHTSGPKLIHLMEGSLTAYGLGGKALATCGPAPKLCFFSPSEELWHFRNNGEVPMRFLLISIDSPDKPTIHEEVGQITNIAGQQVTFAAGDLRGTGLAVPAREVSVSVAELPAGIAVGDRVVTVRHDEKNRRTRSLVKLQTAWQ